MPDARTPATALVGSRSKVLHLLDLLWLSFPSTQPFSTLPQLRETSRSLSACHVHCCVRVGTPAIGHLRS
jgi:hypothetical protein